MLCLQPRFLSRNFHKPPVIAFERAHHLYSDPKRLIVSFRNKNCAAGRLYGSVFRPASSGFQFRAEETQRHGYPRLPASAASSDTLLFLESISIKSGMLSVNPVRHPSIMLLIRFVLVSPLWRISVRSPYMGKPLA